MHDVVGFLKLQPCFALSTLHIYAVHSDSDSCYNYSLQGSNHTLEMDNRVKHGVLSHLLSSLMAKAPEEIPIRTFCCVLLIKL